MTKSIVDVDGSRHTYITFIPYEEHRETHPPVILYLNGFGERGVDGLMEVFENLGQAVWELKRRFPFVVVAPQSAPPDGSWEVDRPYLQTAFRMLDQVVKETDADPNRIYLVGVSSAAANMWSIAEAYPARFAAIVPISSASSTTTFHRPLPEVAVKLTDLGVPIWSAFNRFDKNELTTFNRDLKLELMKAGHSPFYFEYNVTGHDCWNRTLRSPALYDWLLDQNKSSPVRKQFQFIDASKLGEVLAHNGSVDWKVDEQGVFRFSSANETETVLYSRDRYSDFEAHVEVRADLDAEYGFALDSNESEKLSLSLRIVLCDVLRGSGGLTAHDGKEWLAHLHPLSQRSLQKNDWNDIRVRVDGPHLELRVNGWAAFEVTDERLNSRSKQFGFWQRGGVNKATDWRWLRTWTPADQERPRAGEVK